MKKILLLLLLATNCYALSPKYDPILNRVRDYDSTSLGGNTSSYYLNTSSETQTKTGTIGFDRIQFSTTVTNPAAPKGMLQWNEDDDTLELGMGDAVQQIGQEMPVIYVNKSGGLIKNGQPVAYLGTQGNRISVTLAQGNSDATGKVLGVATSDIEKNQEGKVTVFGKVRKIPDVTLFGTGLTTGKIWLATAPAGNYTSTEPSAPNHCDMVGYLVNTGNNQGEIDVNVIPHKTLQELSDVNGTPLTTSGQFPVWDNTRGVFDFTSNVVDIGVSTGMIVPKLLASTNTWTAQQIMTATSISTLVAGTATVTGIMRVGDMWHVVGGTINANTTITIGSANTWYRITNATQNLLSNTHELNGFTITNDSITILNKGHYNGTISISFTGSNTQEYAFRMLNVTQGTSTNYPLSCAGSGSNNNVLYSRGLYIKANANDVIIFQVLNESGTGNITIHDARYEIYYLHD